MRADKRTTHDEPRANWTAVGTKEFELVATEQGTQRIHVAAGHGTCGEAGEFSVRGEHCSRFEVAPSVSARWCPQRRVCVFSRSAEMGSARTVSSEPAVIVVSHGFQKHYETDFVNALACNGVRVLLIGSDATAVSELDARVEFLNLRGSQSSERPAWVKGLNLLAYHARLLACIWRRREMSVHVIGLVTPLLLVGVMENWLFRLIARRLVLTVHDVLPHERHTRWNRWSSRLAYRWPRTLVVHSKIAARKLETEYDVARARIVIVEHGVNRRFVGQMLDKAVACARLDIDPGQRVVLFFGSWGQYKGIDLLIEAMRELGEGWMLLIVGKPGTEDYRRHIESLIDASLARARVRTVARYVDNAEIPVFFGAADVCVLPYRHIDQSGVLFLALAFGIPLVATDVGSFRQYVTPDVGVLVERPDADALRRGLARWAATRDQFQAKRIQAYGDQFRWEHTIVPLLHCYSQ